MLRIDPTKKLKGISFSKLLKGTEFDGSGKKIQNAILSKCTTWGDLQNSPQLFGLKIAGHSTYSVVFTLNTKLEAHFAEPKSPPKTSESKADKESVSDTSES